MSNLASLRERLQKFKMQRQQREKTEGTLDQTQDSTGNTTDHRSWMKRIESQGNRAEDWLLYTNFLVQNVQSVSENTSYDYICNTYSKAIKAISSSGGHKCEAYARLFVNYANFMSQKDIDDARELFYSARTNLRDYAIVHIYAAQFELKQDNIDKCRKIFEKAKDMKVEPSALLEAAHLNFLLGYTEFVSEEQIAKYTGTPVADQPDGKPSKFDTSRDSGISICSGRSDTTRNLTDKDFKDSSSLYHDMSKRTFSTRGGSSSDDSLPLSTSLSNHAFSKPLVPKVSGTTNKMPGLIKPAPVKRDLVSSDCEPQDSPVPSAYGARNRQSMWNNAFLPDNFVQSEEEEGTVSFNVAEKGRKRVGSGGTSEDTVPLSFESSECQYNRPLRSSHSTPDCKNASTLSMASSRKKRFVGKARRMLPQVEEGSTIEERSMDGLSLPIMPDFDVSRTQEFFGADSLVLGINNVSGSTTLTTSHSGHSTLVKTPTSNTRPSEDSPPQEAVPKPTTSEIIITEPPPPPKPQSLQPAPPPKPQLQAKKPEVVHVETPVVQSNVVQAAPAPSQPCPAPEPAPPPPPAQPTVLPPQVKPTAKQEVLVINKKAYTVLNCIGQGGSSSVFEVFDGDHNLRAVKIVNMTGADEPTIKSFKNEIALLQRLQTSDRVITMYDHEFNVRTNLLYVIMERGDPDLATFFSRNKKLNDIQMLYFWQEMLEAVQVLHREGIVHTDLKPANFMIVGGHLKLIDFGIAKAIQQDMTSVTTDQQVGTLNFMSPEALMADSYGSEEDENGQVQRKHKIGYKSDVWSLGCILYRMVYGRTPFQTIRNQLQKMRAIINPSNEIKFPPIPDARLHDVLQKCLIRDPRTRPTIDDLLEHPYLRKTDEPEPPASTQTNATILKLMEQMATASPTSFSACKQSVQGLLEQLMAPRPAQAAGVAGDTKTDLGKEGAAARASQRTPLSSLNPSHDNK